MILDACLFLLGIVCGSLLLGCIDRSINRTEKKSTEVRSDSSRRSESIIRGRDLL